MNNFNLLSLTYLILICFFLNSCTEQKNQSTDNFTLVGMWVPENIKWIKLQDDSTTYYSEIKTYYLKADSTLTISEGTHFQHHDSISYKQNIHLYTGKWKALNGKLNLEYQINDISDHFVFEEIGIGKVIQFNGESYIKLKNQ